MLDKIFDGEILTALNFLPFEKLFEVRVRVNCPITVNFAGKYCFLGKTGVVKDQSDALFADKITLQEIVFRASKYSVYAVNNQLKESFITTEGGIRIGVCGEVVIDDGKIETIKNFTSINVRIPHQVKNCSHSAIKYLLDENGFKNTLVIAPPGAGKTTFIRDVALQLSNLNLAYNLLIVDERFEIAGECDGELKNNVGKFTDVISGSNKLYGFTQGIRSLKPDIIFVDELATKSDCDAIEYAVNCGVKLVATVHALGINDFKNKQGFETIVKNQIFERYVILSNENGPGTYEGIFDKKFNCLYLR